MTITKMWSYFGIATAAGGLGVGVGAEEAVGLELGGGEDGATWDGVTRTTGVGWLADGVEFRWLGAAEGEGKTLRLAYGIEGDAVASPFGVASTRLTDCARPHPTAQTASTASTAIQIKRRSLFPDSPTVPTKVTWAFWIVLESRCISLPCEGGP